jgi:hypothetical protein
MRGYGVVVLYYKVYLDVKHPMQKKTLNYETVAGTLWGAVAICPIIVNGEGLTA